MTLIRSGWPHCLTVINTLTRTATTAMDVMEVPRKGQRERQRSLAEERRSLLCSGNEAVNRKIDAYISVCKSSPDSYRIFLRHIEPEEIHIVTSLSREMLQTVNMLDRELQELSS